jgi:hypothetical protein
MWIAAIIVFTHLRSKISPFNLSFSNHRVKRLQISWQPKVEEFPRHPILFSKGLMGFDRKKESQFASFWWSRCAQDLDRDLWAHIDLGWHKEAKGNYFGTTEFYFYSLAGTWKGYNEEARGENRYNPFQLGRKTDHGSRFWGNPRQLSYPDDDGSLKIRFRVPSIFYKIFTTGRCAFLASKWVKW